MKFYYNGKLMRTSKNHIYKFALIGPTGNCEMCSETFEGCMKEKQRKINYNSQVVENHKAMIEALNDGRSGFHWKVGRESGYRKFTKEDTVEKAQEWAKAYQASADYFTDCKIVELEAR